MALNSARKNAFGDLLRSVSAMGLPLGRRVHRMRQKTHSIAIANSENASGNNGLATRAWQAASNLQKTAASIKIFSQ